MDTNDLKMNLMKEYTRDLQIASQLEPDTEEYKAVIENCNILYKQILETEVKEEEKKSNKKDFWLRLGLGAAGLGVTVAMELVRRGLVLTGFDFEFGENGIIGSQTQRNIFSSALKPNKK